MLRLVGGATTLALAGGGMIGLRKLRVAVLPPTGARRVSGLDASVAVDVDRFGIPTIRAHSRSDATRALGYVTARDRLFQMDLYRRAAAGCLSEVMGRAALEADVEQRIIGLGRIAPAMVARLPNDQREVLEAYAEGVNACLAGMELPPPEMLALGYRARPWTVEDSLLVTLLLYQELTQRAEVDERMLTVMEATLPPEVTAFLTPNGDSYSTFLDGSMDFSHPAPPVPVEALAALRRVGRPDPDVSGAVQAESDARGSNGWVVSGRKTASSAAMLANDIHTDLGVPNLWYRAALHYPLVEIAGVTVPGIPVVIAGSTRHVAWGFTNVPADILDLVQLEVNPEQADEYLTPDGWRPFGLLRETIRVKGGEETVVPVKTTIWGPVARRPLMDLAVAIHWSILDPAAVDIGVLHMDEARSVEDGIRVMHRFGGPPMNAMLADAGGRIAWTYCGKIPRRRGFDGSRSRSWAAGDVGWERYTPPSEVPTVADPPAGFLVTANNRALEREDRHVIGHNFASSYRASQISKRLSTMDSLTEPDMLDLQLDTTSDFYDFYRQVALEALTDASVASDPVFRDVRSILTNWDGKADPDSLAIGILVRLRDTLAEGIFGAYLSQCRAADDRFVYSWGRMDTPLQAILAARIPETVHEAGAFADWESYIRSRLGLVVRTLTVEYGRPLAELSWRRMNRSKIVHPLSRVMGQLGRILDMPPDPLPGCGFSVRLSRPSFSASMRMVVAPSHRESGILHMPAGQSGHPLSPHYKDQLPIWLGGGASPFLGGRARHRLTLKPRPAV